MPDQTSAPPFVSVVMPVRNEEAFIARSLGAMLRQDYPPDRFEVLIVDGMSDDRTRALVQELAAASTVSVRLLDNPARIVPPAMNLGIAAARGEIIVRMDGHTVAAPDYLSCCVAALARTGADNVGGGMACVGEGRFGRAVALATSHPFGIGNAKFHYACTEQEVDTVYLGCWRREAFTRFGLFDEYFLRTQDSEFNYRTRRLGGRIVLCPEIRSQYYNRAAPGRLARQYFQYGFWKTRIMYKLQHRLYLRHGAAPALVAGLAGSLLLLAAGGALAATGRPGAGGALLAGAGALLPAVYLLAVLAVSLRLARREGLGLLPHLALAFATVHLAWGTGFLLGLLRPPDRRRFAPVPSPRPGSGPAAPVTVCHLSSVHNAFDTRILWKECHSLADAGYRVVLIAARKEPGHSDKVRIVDFPQYRSRLWRIAWGWLAMYRRARTERAAIYHCHDPELIPCGLLLSLSRRCRVIYDVHEDVATGIAAREYLPAPFKTLAIAAYRALERLARRRFTLILAEEYYARTIPEGHCILNYPLAGELALPPPPAPCPPAGQPLTLGGQTASWWVLYAGSVTAVRGALVHARLAARAPEFGIYCAGKCPPELAADMREEAGPGRLVLEGVGAPVPRRRLDELAAGYPWLAGLALFPDSPHYREKLLTKFYEYMLAGLPILCSDFPAWREFVTQHGVGLAVPPGDPEAQAAVLRFLAAHPEERQRLGERGRALVRERFLWEREAPKLVELYRRLTAELGAAPNREAAP